MNTPVCLCSFLSMLATHEAQVIPVTWTKHFCVFSSSGTPVLDEDLGVWGITVGEVGLLRCVDVILRDDCLLCETSFTAGSYMGRERERVNGQWSTKTYP